MKKLNGIIALLLVLPIWYYLLYQILVRVNATELMFFLFWIYIPAAMFTQIAAKMATDA